jgi:hypothetical protein
MTRTIDAEYLAAENVLKLDEPLTGVRDHAKLSVEIKLSSTPVFQLWMGLADSLDEPFRAEGCPRFERGFRERDLTLGLPMLPEAR